MNTSSQETAPRPLYIRALRFLILGAFTLILLYVKALAAILRAGIVAVKKVPMEGKKRADS
jgi:hypothetical protein